MVLMIPLFNKFNKNFNHEIKKIELNFKILN